jgi:glutamine amidotransferase
VVDYGSGNLASAARALATVAERHGIEAEVTISGAPEVVAAADRVVVPGQGAFADCMAGIAGLRQALDEVVQAGRPCLDQGGDRGPAGGGVAVAAYGMECAGI